jgi:Uma2 family endonuclease
LPESKRWTRLEYERAIELGLFQPEDRLELIEGVIVKKMPQGALHAAGVQAIESALRPAFGQGFSVRTQLPLALGVDGEPEPDVAVVPGSFRDYLKGHPQSALLAVEVADTSLAVDRTTKAGMYARAGIQEYWIVNLVDRLLEVHRDPGMMAEQPLGHDYRSVQCLSVDQMVSPLAAPSAELRVADLLP